jgi:hypothetical protein
MIRAWTEPEGKNAFQYDGNQTARSEFCSLRKVQRALTENRTMVGNGTPSVAFVTGYLGAGNSDTNIPAHPAGYDFHHE